MNLLKTTRRDAGVAWLERTNPLKGLSIREAQTIFDCARNGDTQRLHWLYAEIESVNPTLLTCVERRASAVAGLDWSVTARPASDPTLGEEQKDAAERFLGGVENLVETVEHLDLGFFRGFAYAQPLWEADGSVRRISLLDSWCFLCRDGRLYYNPECDGFSANAVEVTRSAGLVGLRRRRAIDYPALAIHIREAVGERDWGRFLERIALPKPAVFMAPNATDEDKANYVAAAEKVEDGMVSVWPNGAALTDFMGGSRGQDPFSAFVRHQEERIVLLSTGGTLTSLAESGSGTLAGGAQMEVWREIVARDAVAIEDTLQRNLVIPFLERAFPGKPIAVDLSFDRTRKPTAQEAAQVAATLRSAGYAIDRAELEEATGFTLKEVEVGGMGGIGGMGAKAKATEPTAPSEPKAPIQPQTALEALSHDLSPIGTAIEEFLKDPSKDAAKKLLDDLPKLLPNDSALAAVIAEEMAEAMGEGENAEAREYKREQDGKFSEVDQPRDYKPGKNPDSAETQAAEIGKGMDAARRCIQQKRDIPNAVVRSDIGTIDFVYGDESYGLAHILKKHGEGVLAKLPEVLIRGEVGEPYQQGQKRNIEHGAYRATLRLDRDGRNEKWVLTLFDKTKED